jgi:hypothetical protein
MAVRFPFGGAGGSGVLGRRLAGHGPEIADEVRLVAIAQSNRQTGVIALSFRDDPLRCVIEPVNPDRPLGRETDVFGEHALDGPGG